MTATSNELRIMEDLGFYELQGDGSETIRIIQITDLHQWPSGESHFKVGAQTINLKVAGYKPEQNAALIGKLLDNVKPHAAVLTGDIIDGRPQANRGADDWIATFTEVVQPLIDRNIPWSFVPGNHDAQLGVSPYKRDDLKKVYLLPNCFSRGATSFNHTICLGFGEQHAVRLWLLDSGDEHPDPSIRYTTFEPEVVNSFKALSKSVKKVGPELMYFHIPLPEYGGVAPVIGQNNLFDAVLRTGKVPSPWNHIPWVVRLLGKHHVVGSSTINSGLFDVIAKSDVIATFCGHDHTSDCIVKREGVYLCYGRCGSSTPPSDWEGKIPFPFPRGARVVEAAQGGQVETFIETEFGEEENTRFRLKNGNQADDGSLVQA